MKNRLLHIFLNPIFLSLCISIVIILSLPPIFNKYNTELLDREKTGLGYTFYSDLNNDGVSEKLKSFEYFGNRVGVQVFSKGILIGQWDFNGELLETNQPYTGDINKDGYNDIFVFNLFNDSVIVSSFNPFKDEFYIKDKPITNYAKTNEEKDCIVYSCGLYDTNSDSINEFCFSLCSPYSKTPRKMFVLDIASDTLYSSLESCMNIWKPFSQYTEANGELIFSGNFTAMATCDIEAPYSDWYTWLMVFDERMNFKFDPIKIGNYPSELQILPLKINNNPVLAALNIYYGDKEYPCSISLYNHTGEKIKEKEFVFSEEWFGAKLVENNENDSEAFYIIKRNGTIEEIDTELNIVSSKNTGLFISSIPYRIDIDDNENEEIIYAGKDNEQIIISQAGFDYPVLLDITGNNSFRYCNKILNGNDEPFIYLVCDNYSYVYKYNINPLSDVQYLLYIGIFLGVYFVVFIIQKSQKHRMEQKYKTEKQIAELQLMSLKNQIDPHFILNITNSIGGLLINHDEEKVDYLLGKYGKLLRITLEGSDKISTTLETEIDYVKNYLFLEKLRMNDNFEFCIDVDKSIDMNYQIPKMLIYTFAENAIKHGIRHKKGEGFLNIDVNNLSGNYEIVIKDNGIGRENAKEVNKDCTGKGLSILDKILKLYYSLEKVNITYKINDSVDDAGYATGTEVRIYIPMVS